MKINGRLQFGESGGTVDRLCIEKSQALPLNAKPGEFCGVGRRLFYCADLDTGLPLWIPLTQVMTMFRFQTGSPALEWVINHKLNTNLVIVQLFDTNGERIAPDKIDCSKKNTTTVKFGSAQAGAAIIITGNSVGQPDLDYVYSQEFNASTTWVVNHNLGVNPVISCFTKEGFLVMPDSVVHNSTTTATVTWEGATAGIARCS